MFVNHVTTNPFFVPTQYGVGRRLQAAGLLATSGRAPKQNVNQMVNAINTAVTSGANGIAVSLIELHAFNAPVEDALKAGIPVSPTTPTPPAATSAWPTSART